MSAERPEVSLALDMVFCRVHGEPFRPRWPKGYAIASIELLKAWISTQEETGKIEDVNGILKERPLCCRVSRDVLYAAYLASGVGKSRRCDLCGKTRAGTKFQAYDSQHAQRFFRHVCFVCVMDARERDQDFQRLT